MKTERRHELETNTLSKKLAQWIELVKPYSKVCGGVLVAAVDLEAAADIALAGEPLDLRHPIIVVPVRLALVVAASEFIGIGFLEWRRNRRGYAVAIELFGLGILLVTSFTQSLNGAQGFPYFVLLMFESLLVIWWGVLQKRKIPFFTGIGASVLNIIAQVTVLVNVYNVNIWLVGLGVGLLIMGIAIWVELKREQLRARTRELTETLEKWE